MAEETSSISGLVLAIERLAEGQADTNKKVDKLVESMGKQEVILEKLANIERAHADSVKRIYLVIDEVKDRVLKIEDKHLTNGCFGLQRFITSHDNELRHNLEKLQECEEFKKTVETELNDIKMKPLKAMDKVWMAILGAIGGGIGLAVLKKMEF